MKYPIAIHKDPHSSYGVTIPDLPSCFSAGATIDDAMEQAKEAICGHLEILAEDGQLASATSTIDQLMTEDQYQGAIWAYVDVDISQFTGKTDKVLITMPKILTYKIDQAVAKGAAKSRSAFLAESALRHL